MSIVDRQIVLMISVLIHLPLAMLGSGLDFELTAFLRVCTALLFAIWLLNTGALGFAQAPLSLFGRIIQITLAVGLLIQVPTIQYALICASLLLFAVHRNPALTAKAGLLSTPKTPMEELVLTFQKI